jgi:hypothetical protein
MRIRPRPAQRRRPGPARPPRRHKMWWVPPVNTGKIRTPLPTPCVVLPAPVGAPVRLIFAGKIQGRPTRGPGPSGRGCDARCGAPTRRYWKNTGALSPNTGAAPHPLCRAGCIGRGFRSRRTCRKNPGRADAPVRAAALLRFSLVVSGPSIHPTLFVHNTNIMPNNRAFVNTETLFRVRSRSPIVRRVGARRTLACS